MATGASDVALARAVGRVNHLYLVFDVASPVLYTGSNDLSRDGNSYGSGSVLQAGTYSLFAYSATTFDEAHTGEVRAGQTMFDVATSSLSYRFQAVQVPAPAIVPLMLSGLVGFTLLRRRRKMA